MSGSDGETTWSERVDHDPHCRYPLRHAGRNWRTDDDINTAAEVIRCGLAGSEHVFGRWWSAKPIRLGLERIGITEETVIEAALKTLGVEVRQQGATGVCWRLDHVPQLRRPAIDRIAECSCGQRSREWRLATGGAWTCALCHPPADGLAVEYRATTEDRQ
jgi:hypothetical protein